MQTDDPDFLQQSGELINFYRNNPEIAAEDLLRLDLSGIQKVVLRSMWFKNYVMAIMCRGSGKCVSGDTYLFTNKGIKKIKEINSEIEILTDTDVSVSNGHSLYPAQKSYYDGIKATNNFITQKGFSIASTDDHPLLTLSPAGDLEWKKSYDIQEGDYLVIERGANIWGNNYVEPDYAYFLGLLVGDGCLSRENIVSFTNEDDDLLNKFIILSKRFLGYTPLLRKPKDRARHCTIYSKKIRSRLIQEGLDISVAPRKKIPWILLSAQREALVSFLQACFDTDGWFFSGKNEVGFCSSSPDLAEIVHLLLLNLGIVSKKRFKPNKKAGSYLIELYGADVKLFAQNIGFRCERKQTLLQNYLNTNLVFNTNLDVIPHQKKRMRRIFEAAQKHKDVVPLVIRRELSHYSQLYSPSYSKLESLLSSLPFQNEDTQFLQTMSKRRYLFDVVKKKTYRAEKVYDLVMPEISQHAFVGNGFINHNTFLDGVVACLKCLLYPGHRVGLLAPTFRQSKMIFDECDRIWQGAPILQAATIRRPTHQSDNCYIKFKAVGGKPGAIIQSIPLGDGTKIRGSRFFTIICDEFPHIPEEIFNLVIRPMAATVSSPMENVRRIEREKRMLEAGVLTEDDLDDTKVANQIIITSSGYFMFNHMFKLYCVYRDEMQDGNEKYAVFRVPYKVLPEGFLDEDNVQAALREMSSLEFRMEYEAAFIPDTDGFYKASLIESCKSKDFTTQVAGSAGRSYILGIDPARTEDSFAICVAEIGKPSRIVHAIEAQKQTFPKMAETIEDLCSAFNVQKIYMDAGGGGLAIKDILAENRHSLPAGPILDPEDEVHSIKQGRHILQMCNFTTNFIEESNHAALSLMEHGQLRFPTVPKDSEPTPAQEESWETIKIMQQQMQIITITETKTGKIHFDVPKGEGPTGQRKQKKDLYTAFMLAARCVYDLLWSEELPENIIHHGGVLRSRENRVILPGSQMSWEENTVPQVLRDKLEIATDPEGYRQKMLTNTVQRRKVLTSPVAVLKPVPKRKK